VEVSASLVDGFRGFHGYKNLNVDWVTDETLKIELWPGGGNSLKLVELYDVTAGKTLLRTATRYTAHTPTNAVQEVAPASTNSEPDILEFAERHSFRTLPATRG